MDKYTPKQLQILSQVRNIKQLYRDKAITEQEQKTMLKSLYEPYQQERRLSTCVN